MMDFLSIARRIPEVLTETDEQLSHTRNGLDWMRLGGVHAPDRGITGSLMRRIE
jgi:hypothetical protein